MKHRDTTWTWPTPITPDVRNAYGEWMKAYFEGSWVPSEEGGQSGSITEPAPRLARRERSRGLVAPASSDFTKNSERKQHAPLQG